MSPEEEVVQVATVQADDNVGRPVRIRWVDSGAQLVGWRDREDVLKQNVDDITSVGIWMGENGDVVMLGGSHTAEKDRWSECQLIWKPSILETEWLR